MVSRCMAGGPLRAGCSLAGDRHAEDKKSSLPLREVHTSSWAASSTTCLCLHRQAPSPPCLSLPISEIVPVPYSVPASEERCQKIPFCGCFWGETLPRLFPEDNSETISDSSERCCSQRGYLLEKTEDSIIVQLEIRSNQEIIGFHSHLIIKKKRSPNSASWCS